MLKMTNYHAYILRLWSAREADAPTHRATLEPITPGARRSFTDIEALISFLRTEYDQSPSPPGDPPAAMPYDAARADREPD